MRWLPFLAPVAPSGGERGGPMAIKINDHFLYLEIDGAFIASAKEDGNAGGKSATGPGSTANRR